MTSNDVRAELIEALQLDLVGPRTGDPAHARYAEEVRRASRGRSCTFLGWSWGGLLAYEAARMLYRNRTVSLTTEMQGMLPAYMSPVAVVPDLVGGGHVSLVQHIHGEVRRGGDTSGAPV